ncbi:Protein TYR-5 [Aphelenchoides avenae]|nr:Protein TYR-5 [Aphelenchus avenae]
MVFLNDIPAMIPSAEHINFSLELVYRTFNPDMGLPYWDSTLDNNLPEPKDSVMFSKYLMGDTDEDGNVTYGAFHNWTTIDGRPTFQRLLQTELDGEFFNDARINFVMNQTEISRVLAYSLPLHTCINYTMDDRFLEYSHDYVHYYISGDMQERFSSSNDPIFIMHHGFVDSIWETWRQLRQTRDQREYQYPDDNPNCMPAWHFLFSPMPLLEPFRNIDALSNSYTDNLYEYAPRPTCRSKSEECGSEFLFCDTETNAEPKCSSKVKLGGNCSGFEWSKDVCYEGHCVQGRCVHKKDIEAKNDLGQTKPPHSQKYM